MLRFTFGRNQILTTMNALKTIKSTRLRHYFHGFFIYHTKIYPCRKIKNIFIRAICFSFFNQTNYSSFTTTFNLISVGGPTIAGPAHPGSEPPVGPEEALRYSCVDTLCLQDPNGLYYGLDECLAAGCSLSGGGGGDTDPPDPPEPPDPPVILQCYDRAVHCTFAAMILDVTSDSPLNPSPNCTLNGSSGTSLPNRTYWKYEWAEVEAIGAERETWCTPLTSGNTPRLGDELTDTWAINVFEMGVDDAGGDVAPGAATVNRLQIPQYSIVTLHIGPNGRASFCEKNPIEVVCDSGALTLTLDGGEFNGGG